MGQGLMCCIPDAEIYMLMLRDAPGMHPRRGVGVRAGCFKLSDVP